ncbi:MAG: hypothetical protein H8D49_02250 [Dehalococcoidia bacterium]|nr:hypothetical protein [Dehalococcoidia bacterium]MBL7165203.1 hypothetical protein [Dehalococcoidales bacterium]
MAILTLVLGLAGGICSLLGIVTALDLLPTFIKTEEAIGPIAATTAFFWGLAALLFLASIAVSVGHSGDSYD